MFSRIKRWFVPHAGNGHYPSFWRRGSLSAVVAIALLAGSARFVAPLLWGPDSFLASILPAAIVAFTNEERADLAEPELAVNPLLEEAARLKAEDMAARGYFAHQSPEGWAPWHWLEVAGYGYVRAGENLAVNFDDSDDVVDAWMGSPTHRANIVKGAYTEIGVGMARGRYDGKNAIYVAQFFGTPQAGFDAATVIAAMPGATTSTSSVAATGSGDEVSVAPAAPSAVAGAQTEIGEKVAAIAASPRTVGSYVLWGLLGLVTVAFAVAVLVVVRIQFRAILLGGTGLIIALVGLIWLESHEPDADRLLGGQPATSTEQANR